MRTTPHFSRDTVRPAQWLRYQKRVVIQALRVAKPFTVETREGTRACPDGYLVLDDEGWPYPIAREEFDAVYSLVLE